MVMAFANHKSLRAVVGMLAILSGCSGMPPYEPPRSGPMAQLRIATTFDGVNMQVRRFRAEDCADYPGELVGRLNSRTIGDTFSRELNTTVPANEPFRVSVYAVVAQRASMPGDGTIRSRIDFCLPALEFVPQQGRRYEILHQAGDRTCALQVAEVTAAGRASVASSSKTSWCEAAHYKKR